MMNDLASRKKNGGKYHINSYENAVFEVFIAFDSDGVRVRTPLFIQQKDIGFASPHLDVLNHHPALLKMTDISLSVYRHVHSS